MLPVENRHDWTTIDDIMEKNVYLKVGIFEGLYGRYKCDSGKIDLNL